MITKLLFIFLLVLPMLFAKVHGLGETKINTQQIDVAYRYRGEYHHYVGEKHLNSYLFNQGASKKVDIATLDWPPYIGRGLCDLGWALQLAVAVFTSQGYQVSVNFLPWVRAVKMVESGKMDVLYPEYYIEESAVSDIFPNNKRRDLLALSTKFIGGNVSFIKRHNDPFIYNGNLNSIIGKSVGVVRGYQNTPEFDAIMDAKRINVVEAINDAQLLKLLLASRVDLIVGDPSVFGYITDNTNQTMTQKLETVGGIEPMLPELKYNHLYFSVSKRIPHWKTLINDINVALLSFEKTGEITRIYQGNNQCPSYQNKKSQP